jgi:hypothetical protein
MSRIWRQLLRIFLAQLVAGLFGASIIWALWGALQAQAFLAGTLILATGFLMSARFGLRNVGTAVESAAFAFAAVGFRWVWVLAAFFVVMGRWHWPALPAVLGLISAEAVFVALGMKQPHFVKRE